MSDEIGSGQTGVPPRLEEERPPLVPVVLESPGALQTGAGAMPPRRWGAPVHPLAALVLIGVDNLWNLADWMVVDWVITIPLSFAMVFLPVLVIQRWVRRDGWGRAGLLALVLGTIAAIPTSIFGSPVGVALLAWFGIDQLLGRPTRPEPARLGGELK